MIRKSPTPIVGQTFAFARKAMHLSMDGMAAALNTSKTTLCRIEHGVSSPSPQQFSQLARITGYTPTALAQAMLNNEFHHQPGLDYQPALPQLEQLSRQQLDVVHTCLLNDIHRAQRKLQRTTQALKSQQEGTQIRQVVRAQKQAVLERQQQLLCSLQELGADETALESQRINVAEAEEALRALPSEQVLKEAKSVYNALRMEHLAQELAAMEADLVHVRARMTALDTQQEPEPVVVNATPLAPVLEAVADAPKDAPDRAPAQLGVVEQKAADKQGAGSLGGNAPIAAEAAERPRGPELALPNPSSEHSIAPRVDLPPAQDARLAAWNARGLSWAS